MLIQRKEFLQWGSLATASLLIPKFLKALEVPTIMPPSNKVLVVLQLSGGNDGLNTVVPISNDIYYKLRPKLGIKKETTLSLTDEVGLHPALPAFKTFYDEGSLAILNGVGYPNPNRSHFRSMDIWHSASDSNVYTSTGWLGRYVDAQCHDCNKPTQALEFDDVLSLAMKGNHRHGLALKDPQKLYNTSHEKFYTDLLQQHTIANEENPIDYLYKTMAQTINSADYIFQESKQHPTQATYPATALGKNFKTIASLILSNINTKVYYLSLGSFDTHIFQEAQQKRLFTEMNDAIQVFVTDLKTNHRFNDVLITTFSEFGRRVKQNASGGTDHGTANNMFFIGGGLAQKGLLNALPNLDNLQDGDLKYSVDFKNVYATLLHKWLTANDKEILGQSFQYLNFI
jgi:uncharacterized protein (DUF1501 family)